MKQNQITPLQRTFQLIILNNWLNATGNHFAMLYAYVLGLGRLVAKILVGVDAVILCAVVASYISSVLKFKSLDIAVARLRFNFKYQICSE